MTTLKLFGFMFGLTNFRGFCLVVCVIYNPLTNDKNEFMKHLSTKLDIALTKYPNTKVVLVGDFKQVSIFSLM